jgi:hypothetical protein
MCYLMAFLVTTFLDDAFEASELRTPQDLFRLKLQPPQRCFEIRFKASILSTPIYRGAHGKALTYATASGQIHRFGRAAGFKQRVTSYCLRRGTANAIHGTSLHPVIGIRLC